VSRCALLALAASTALAPAAARAHEVLHEVERGRAIAVKAYFADGEVLAYSSYEVYAPADPTIPWQKGRTDRAGWLAFVPDGPGRWRVKVVDQTGHGLDVAIDAATPPAAAVPAARTIPAGAAFVLRPILGVAAICALFGALYALYRRKGPAA
jgi:nickel transport protein